MRLHNAILFAAATALTAAAFAMPIGAANEGLVEPQQPVTSLDVALDGWAGTINLFGDGSGELSTGESLGSWWAEHDEDGAAIHINMGSYGNGSELTLQFVDTYEVGESGGAQLEIGSSVLLGVASVVTKLELPTMTIGDQRFKPAPGTEHPAGNPVVSVCLRKRGNSSVYIAKLQNGKEGMILPPNAGINHGEGFYQLDGKVYFVKWNGKQP